MRADGVNAAFSTATLRAAARVVTAAEPRIRFAMRGGGMLPLLRAPMILDVVPLRHRAHVGDVIVFPLGDRRIAHRVVRFAGDGYVTSGDATPRALERIAHAEVIGRVEAVWSNDTAAARRIDGLVHRIAGRSFAALHPARRILAFVNARATRAFPRRSSIRWRRHA